MLYKPFYYFSELQDLWFHSICGRVLSIEIPFPVLRGSPLFLAIICIAVLVVPHKDKQKWNLIFIGTWWLGEIGVTIKPSETAAGQKQMKPERPQACALGNSVQSLRSVTSNCNMVLQLYYGITSSVTFGDSLLFLKTMKL